MTDLQLFATLTQKERKVLRLFVSGATDDPSLARELGVSRSTLSHYFATFYDLTGMSTRAELMMFVLKRPELERLLMESEVRT